MISLREKGVLVIGSRRLLGETIVRRLADEGARIAVAYRSSRNEADELAALVQGKADRTCVVQGDITIEFDANRMVADTVEQLGGLSFLVNLASDYPRTPFNTLDASAWEKGMATARGAYNIGVSAARAIAKQRGPTRGHMIFFGDWAAEETPYIDYLPYLTGKAAVHFMTRAFAVELAQQGILVNCIAPGPVQRPPDLPDKEWNAVLRKAPLRREASAADIAEIIMTLLKSETITGELIRVDSGRHLAGP